MADETDIRRARSLAKALDSAVGIPGTPIRVGLDAILGLIPGGGDVAGAALSGYIVLSAARLGASPAVIGRMLLNVLLDTTLGAVPVLGDLFDVAFKSNMRNVALLERYATQPIETRKQSKWLLAGVVVALLVIVVAVGALAVVIARALWRMLTG